MDIINPETKPHTDACANCFSLDVPCITANSPPASALTNTTIERAINPHICLSSLNVTLLNNGAKDIVISAPNNPTNHDHLLTTVIIIAMRCLLRVELLSDMSLTLLFLIPSPANVDIISTALLYSPINPIPAGPIQIAMSFVRIMEHMMLTTCTPPNRLMALMMVCEIFIRFSLCTVSNENLIGVINYSSSSHTCFLH